MKNSDIKGLTVSALSKAITEEKNGLFNLKFAHAISPLENPSQIKQKRRLIARLETELSSKTKA
jgi:large subunit ribosomal protein L29